MSAGLTNEYLINTDSPAALTYNDRSINENGHAALAFGILLKDSNNFLEVWSSFGLLDQWKPPQRVAVSPFHWSHAALLGTAQGRHAM